MIETIIASLASAAVGALLAWLKTTKAAKLAAEAVAKASRFEKVIGIGKVVAEEFGPTVLKLAAGMASKTQTKLDDRFVEEMNQRLFGQGHPPMDAEDEAKLVEALTAPKVDPPADAPKLDKGTLGKLKAGG